MAVKRDWFCEGIEFYHNERERWRALEKETEDLCEKIRENVKTRKNLRIVKTRKNLRIVKN